MKLLIILIVSVIIVCETKTNKVTTEYYQDNGDPDVTTENYDDYYDNIDAGIPEKHNDFNTSKGNPNYTSSTFTNKKIEINKNYMGSNNTSKDNNIPDSTLITEAVTTEITTIATNYDNLAITTREIEINSTDYTENDKPNEVTTEYYQNSATSDSTVVTNMIAYDTTAITEIASTDYTEINKVTTEYYQDSNGASTVTVRDTRTELPEDNYDYYIFESEENEGYNNSYTITTEEIGFDYNNCTGTLTYLHVNPDLTNGKLEVSWDSNPSEICFYEYKVIKTEMSRLTTTTQTINVNKTTYTFHDLRPCTKYNITIEMFLLNSKDVLAKKTEIFDTDPIVPKSVRNLNLEIRNHKTLISWLPPKNKDCIKGYRIHKKNLLHDWTSVDVTNTSIETNENLFCTKIEVNAITKHDKIGTPAQLLKPGPVQNSINSSTTDTSITVSWEKPEIDWCVRDYILRTNTSSKEFNTEKLEYIFNSLTSCTTYLIEIAANSIDNVTGEYESISVTTSHPKEISDVENLNYTINGDDVTVTWEPPANAETCNIEYSVQVVDENDKLIYDEVTSETSHLITFTSWLGCVTYKIRVNARINTTESKFQEIILVLPRVTKPPICVNQIEKKTAVSIKCDLDPDETSLCELQQITVNCTAPNEENSGNWVIWKQTVSQDIINLTPPFQIYVDDLSEFTNYTCSATILNSKGNSTPSELVKFQTKEGVPDPPHLKPIDASTSRSIYMQWSEPEYIRGILIGYNIMIKPIKPKYFVPNIMECHIEHNPYSHSEPPSSHEYTFLEALPMYEYVIDIQAQSRAGPSNISTGGITTLAETPEQPRNVDFDVQVGGIQDYDVNATIMWSYPCYTYGHIKYFKIDFKGVPFADLNNSPHTGTEVINIKDLTDLDYTYIIPDLKPACNYTVHVSVIPEETNLNASSVSIEFSSPDGYPEPPVINKPTETTNESITFTWEKPPQTNGIIKSYQLELINEGPMYFVPNDKECHRTLQNYSYTLPASANSYEFKTGVPYHSYEAGLTASTSEGSSELSEYMKAQTLESEPEKVRKLTEDLETQKTEIYNVSIMISFKYPCNTYGLFEKFTVRVDGSRLNYSSDVREFELIKQEEEYQVEFNELKPEYNYLVSVKVYTEKYQSKISKLTFLSPSGVPPKTEGIIAPVPYDSTKANYTLNKNLFNAEFGKILYYALIIGTVDENEHSKYGFWNGDENSWPEIQKSEDTTVPYQATPNLWNPFDEDSKSDFYVFVLGDDSISASNKPLKPGITYTLKVRGFTLNGYRDSSTVKFEMPAAVNLALILGLVFGIIGTGILLGFMFIFWRRRRQWNMKKESIKSIPLTPMPVSIKRFPNHYMALKNNNEKLKQEFTLLGTMGNELTLPTYDGLLPENKKKNRYTNIIPYDQTRVKLVDINDNSSTTDYINASYIQGFSNNIEYIATQGPLEHTCMDFWKMVMQENTSLIVMVAQFVEQNKDKCYKYFPDNHENMELENGVCIRCCTELDFKTHIVRTLLVQKDLQQWTVTHLQFTDWPDFGCPEGSEVILEFCQIMREHAEKSSHPIVIHCSAGVGRTGTLIALDILLQAINREQDIDIFGTVLNLRRDRKNMVQTEKQYLFIHTCVHDALENPVSVQIGNDLLNEPIYENVNDIKKDYEGMDESKF